MRIFYLRTVIHGQGKFVDLRIGVGDEKTHEMRGSITFKRDEWEAFRPFVTGGMRTAGFMRVPIEFSDQTRKKPH